MKPIPFVVGLALSAVVLFIAYTDGGYHSMWAFFSGWGALSYVVYSSFAFIVSRLGKSRNAKAWMFFVGGFCLISVYVPSIRNLVELFYVPGRGYDDQSQIWFFRDFCYTTPMIIGALCIYRGIVLWSDADVEKIRKDDATSH